MPRNRRGSHGFNNDYTRQKHTNELINLAIFNDIFNTINLNNKTTRTNLTHKADVF